MKTRLASLFVLLLLIASFANAQTPGSTLVPALDKLSILWRGFSDLDKGPDGDQWYADLKAYDGKAAALKTRWSSYDPRVDAFDVQDKALGAAIDQWNYNCGKATHPNGIPEPQYSQCTQQKAALLAQQQILNPQRDALNSEFAQLKAEDSALKAEYAVLMRRADTYNIAKQSLIDQYNAQLVLAKTLVTAYLDCSKATPTACGTVGDWTVERLQRVLTYTPRPPLGVSPPQWAGTYRGTWTGDGFSYSLVLTLDWEATGGLVGQIAWTLTGVPTGDKYDAARAKIGRTATEYIKGSTGQMEGYSKTDPDNIIGLDTYRLKIEKGNLDLIQGSTLTNQKDWSGQFIATRVKQ